MTVTAISVPNTDQGPTSAPLVLSCDSDTSALTIWATFPLSPDPQQVELIWGGSAFAPRYAASTQVAGLFTIKRIDGWTSRVVLSFQEGPAAAKYPALQDYTLFGGATAAWTMLKNPASLVMLGTDRTGNGYTLTTPSAKCMPAQGTLGAALMPAVLGGAYKIASGNGTPVRLGAMSFTFVFQANPIISTAANSWIYAKGNSGISTGNVSFAVFLYRTGSAFLSFEQDHGTNTPSYATFSSLPTPTDGLWHFGAVTRNSAGTSVTGYIDGVSQTITGLTAPTDGSLGVDCLGAQSPNANTEFTAGSLYDGVLWPVELTPTQITTLRNQAMGL